MIDPEIKGLLSEFSKFSLRPPAWTYAHATYPLKKQGYIFASDGHDPFIYDSDFGRYVPANDRLRIILAGSMKKDWTPARVRDVLIWYRDSAPRLWETPPLDRVNVLNGILNIESGDREPHSPGFLSPIQFNAAWDPEARCPAIDQFVQRVFPYPESTEGGRRVSVLKWQEGAPVLLG